MRAKELGNIVVIAVIAALGGTSYVLLRPQTQIAPAAAPARTITLYGVVRDFRAEHVDFDVVPDLGYGHYAGNVTVELPASGRPIFTGPPPDASDDGELAPLGHDTAFGPTQDDVKDTQVAMRVELPVDAKLLSITARVGRDDRDVRYALYTDVGGEPGDLVVETDTDETDKDEMEWMTLGVPETPLTAGAYWLALAFEDDKQEYAYSDSGGATREVEHDAAKHGFLSSWGPSDASSPRRIAIYGTLEANESAGGGVGGGFRVESEWADAQGRPIAPHMFGAGGGGDNAIDFVISDQAVIPTEAYAVKVTVLGAAIQAGSGGYHRPVTMKTHIGDSNTYEPFGGYEAAVAGNLNDDQTITGNANCCNPRSSVLAEVYSPLTPIWVTGRSWKLIDNDESGHVESNWQPKMTASTLDGGPQVRVLRNGDPVPDIDGLYDQDSIAEYVSDYVNTDTGTMTLGVNEIIYLFEVGESGNSSTADFQDLVVLIELANDPGGFTGGTTLCGVPLADVAGSAGGPSGGGITSAESFGQWYRDVMGTNLSQVHAITLTRNADGVYEYLDDAFHPIDDGLFGNEGQPHNHYFTYAIEASFVYEPCAGQFIEFEGADDAWVFVNDRLVMDVGGVLPWTSQHVAIDRLGLADGQRYPVHIFHAQRQNAEAQFRLRTNMQLETPSTPSTVSGGYD